MRQLSTSVKLLLLFVLFSCIVGASQLLFSRVRVDLTQDRLFTLDDGTHQVLKTLKEPIKLKLTYSERAAAGYPEIQAYAQQVNDLLDSFARSSRGKITVERVNPAPFSEGEDLAVQSGLHGAPTDSGDTLYFGLEATNSTTGRKVIPFFSTDREPQLEYDLIKLITQLENPAKQKIALYTTLPMAFGPGGPVEMVQGRSRPFAIYQQLREQFNLFNLAPDFTEIPADVNLLVLAHPNALSDVQQFAIDQFVLRGGRLMLFVDPISEMSQSVQNSGAMLAGTRPPPISSDMPALLSAWGLKLTAGQVAADGKFAQQVSTKAGQPIYYLPWIGVQSSTFAKDDLTIQGLRQINLATSGILEMQPRPGVQQEALFSTSDLAGVFDATVFMNDPDPATLIQTFKPTGAQYVLAARLSGTFSSAFNDPPVLGQPHVLKSSKPTTILVVADTDMLADALWLDDRTKESDILRPVADNGSFFFNTVDQMLGASELLALRSRRPAARPFTLVQEKQIEAERDLRSRQSDLMDELKNTQGRITQLEGTGGSGEKFLSAPQKAEIEKFRKKVTETRKSLRQIQGSLRQSVDVLKTKITLANVATVPLLLLLIALLRALIKSRRARA